MDMDDARQAQPQAGGDSEPDGGATEIVMAHMWRTESEIEFGETLSDSSETSTSQVSEFQPDDSSDSEHDLPLSVIHRARISARLRREKAPYVRTSLSSDVVIRAARKHTKRRASQKRAPRNTGYATRPNSLPTATTSAAIMDKSQDQQESDTGSLSATNNQCSEIAKLAPRVLLELPRRNLRSRATPTDHACEEGQRCPTDIGICTDAVTSTQWAKRAKLGPATFTTRNSLGLEQNAPRETEASAPAHSQLATAEKATETHCDRPAPRFSKVLRSDTTLTQAPSSSMPVASSPQATRAGPLRNAQLRADVNDQPRGADAGSQDPNALPVGDVRDLSTSNHAQFGDKGPATSPGLLDAAIQALLGRGTNAGLRVQTVNTVTHAPASSATTQRKIPDATLDNVDPAVIQYLRSLGLPPEKYVIKLNSIGLNTGALITAMKRLVPESRKDKSEEELQRRAGVTVVEAMVLISGLRRQHE
ncbi:uncharacterized protein B0H18DRAFT_1120255 [Fomitopsis serialis]|uniref:uncharacterized protein n=1 Tax=Fomitopsis serialis TaxID=139415 RepID=UPI002008AA32|nr:uncharacterized protein B0H18DRAFT_1120255 [Neoantrodia serialis]KAH9923595.1 hypothetical protein B0H18DRAFT_1120255 [Neoantrodia serialis]